jgi:hypothetical protein
LEKGWNKVEKVIGVIGILFGFVMLTFFTYSWSTTLYTLIEEGHTTWDRISIVYFLKNEYPIILLYALSIISGFLLLKSLKIGWITSILSWIFQACYLLWKVFTVTENSTYTTDKDALMIIGVIVLLFLTIPTILFQKPFRQKYG